MKMTASNSFISSHNRQGLLSNLLINKSNARQLLGLIQTIFGKGQSRRSEPKHLTLSHVACNQPMAFVWEALTLKKLGQYSLAGVLAMILMAGAILWSGHEDRLIKTQVAVVLGNEVYANGQPAPRLAARLDKSIELYRYGYCQTIIVSGGVGKSNVDEAVAMASYLKSKGVPEWNIVVDSQGVNTWRTAQFTADYLEAHHLESVIVVSQSFHIPRSAMALKKAGCQKVGQASPSYWEMGDIYSVLREIPALLVYWWKY